MTRWWFPAVPGSRIAVLRAAIYLFVVFDVFVLVNDIVPHSHAPKNLYQPLAIPRVLHLPAPTPTWVLVLRAVLVLAALVAATGRWPRVAGWVVAFAYLEWVFLGMSYGKVDHDQLALLTALFVLPTLSRRHWDDHRLDEGAGWALRCIQVAVVATYTLSVWGKISHGGWNWPTGATFYWAVERRGTFLGEHLVNYPDVLVASQWVVIIAEAAAPVVFFVRGRARLAVIAFYLGFHLVTYATISIHFLPLVICWAAFAPLENVADALRRRSLRLLGGVPTRALAAVRPATGQAGAVRRDGPVEAVGDPAERRKANQRAEGGPGAAAVD